MPTSRSWPGCAWALAGCLILSGAAALIYEVLWLRQLGLVMGHTAYALSTVLTSFLGGLALGAYAGGRWVKRGLASARLYAAIELAIALVAVAMPLLIAALDPVFGVAYRALTDRFLAYNVVQFALSGAVLLVPTFLMGTTLPIVAGVVVRREDEVGASTGLLYALNSLGGVLGASLAGFVLLPGFGMAATGRIAAALNVVAALVAFAAARRSAAGAAPAPANDALPVEPARASEAPAAIAEPALRPAGWPVPGPGFLAVLYATSGFAALALQVGWARLVGFSMGSTTYSFTITVSTYIVGLALGSLILPRIRPLARDPVRALFLLHAVIALWTIATLPYLGDLPGRVLDLFGAKDLSVHRVLAGQTLLVLATIAVPTIAMGGMFPLVTQLLQRAVASTGYATGLSYAANTLGNIAGSWIAGFVLIPAIGMRGTVMFSAFLSAAVGMLYLAPALRSHPSWTLLRAGALAAAVALLAWWLPSWQQHMLVTAPYLLAKQVAQVGSDKLRERLKVDGEILEQREGPTGIVTVQKSANMLFLYQDGLDESGSHGHAIRLLGHLPMLFHGNAKDVLIVGLGGGQTLRAVLSYPIDRVDSVEISEDVRQVAEKYFAADLLADPRSHVIIGDARNHLRYAPELYDVIISQPSYPWMAGASDLFTREYFEDLRDRLKPGGVACSWFFTFDDPSRESIIRAFSEVFPNAYLLMVMGQPRALIGMRDPRPIDDAAMALALASPAAVRDLQAFGLRTPADVKRLIVGRDAGLKQRKPDAPVNSDDNSYVGFNALRGLFE
jgi:spermidine synthase